MKLKSHPAAEIFPLMEGPTFDALVGDIREHGQREPIVVLERLILDGRNRYRACQKLGIKPITVEWDGSGTPEAYVISKNVHRRHLNETQRAMIAARLATLKKGDVSSQRNMTEDGVQICTPSLAAEQVGQLLNVSRRNIQYAKTVLNEGTPEEVEDLEQGHASVSTVARQIRDRASKKYITPRHADRIEEGPTEWSIWVNFNMGLRHLKGLPPPSNLVRIVRAKGKANLVDEDLLPCLDWLKEFERLWRLEAA